MKMFPWSVSQWLDCSGTLKIDDVKSGSPVHFHLHEPEPDLSAEVLDEPAADSGGAQDDQDDVPVPYDQVNLEKVSF